MKKVIRFNDHNLIDKKKELRKYCERLENVISKLSKDCEYQDEDLQFLSKICGSIRRIREEIQRIKADKMI